LEKLLSLYVEQTDYADLLVQYMLLAPDPESKYQQEHLRRLIKNWRREGKALTLEEISVSSFDSGTKKSIRKVGFRILKGIENHQVQGFFLRNVQRLLPDVFLGPLGWQNFSPVVPPVLIQIAEKNSGSSKNRVPDDFEAIAKYLYRNINKMYIKELFLVAAALMNEGGKEEERNSPSSIITIIKSINMLFKYLFSDLGIRSVAELDPDVYIRKYLNTDLPNHSAGTKLQCYRFYVDGRNAVERWRKAHPKTQRELGTWCLPAFKLPIDTTELEAQAARETASKRHGQLAALMPVYLPLLSVVHHRACVFAEISAAFDQAWLEMQERAPSAAADPFPLMVVLSDGSATLQFVILARSGRDRLAAVCEYLGATDASGQPLPLPFFALMQRGFYDETYRAELKQYGILPNDCDAQTAGLLRPASDVSAFCRNEYVQARREKRTAKIYLSIDALGAAAAFGSLAVMIDYSSSIRIHEVLQIRIEPGYINVDDEEGYTTCLIYQKGDKGSKLQGTKILLEPFVTYFLRTTIIMKRKINGVFRNVHMDGGKNFRFTPGPYLFQWNNGPIYGHHLTSLIRFMAFGVTYQSPSDEFKNLKPHDLRHGQMRAQHALGRTVKTIQRNVGHHRENMTLYYLGLLEGRQQSVKFGQLAPITMWGSMLPDAITRLQQKK